MAAHHLEGPARAVGHAVEVDLALAQRRGEIGHVVGQRRRRIHGEVDLAPVQPGPAAHQDVPLLLFRHGAAARLGGIGGAGVETVEIGRRAAGAALAQDDDVAAAADGRRLVPPVALAQRVGARRRGHQRRVTGTAGQIDERLDAGRALGLEDGDLQLDLAALRLLAILRHHQDEAFDPVALGRLEGTALALQPRRGRRASCQNQQESCQAAQEPQSRHGYLVPHRSL